MIIKILEINAVLLYALKNNIIKLSKYKSHYDICTRSLQKA